MKVAIYPGSFWPWHVGHSDILQKATKIFDKVIVAIGRNPEKDVGNNLGRATNLMNDLGNMGFNVAGEGVVVKVFDGFLSDFVKKEKAHAVIRGLRNGNDLQYEMNQQYWNEDLGLEAPIVYFICDRKYSHISSSMMRAVEKIKDE